MPCYDLNFKIILLGDAPKEKVSFAGKYVYNVFNPSERLSIGVDFSVRTMEVSGRRIKMQIWDTVGDERFRFLLPTYCLGANGAILLYDITNSDSLNHLAEYASIIRGKAGPIPIILIGSQIHLKKYRAVSRKEGILTAEKNHLSAFAEISSQTGQNVNQIFKALA